MIRGGRRPLRRRPCRSAAPTNAASAAAIAGTRWSELPCVGGEEALALRVVRPPSKCCSGASIPVAGPVRAGPGVRVAAARVSTPTAVGAMALTDGASATGSRDRSGTRSSSVPTARDCACASPATEVVFMAPPRAVAGPGASVAAGGTLSGGAAGADGSACSGAPASLVAGTTWPSAEASTATAGASVGTAAASVSAGASAGSTAVAGATGSCGNSATGADSAVADASAATGGGSRRGGRNSSGST